MSKRDEYVAKLKAQLDAWNGDIDRLEGKARVATAEAKTKLDEQVTSLKGLRDDATAKLAALREASEDKWEGLKGATEAAWAAFKERLAGEDPKQPMK